MLSIVNSCAKRLSLVTTTSVTTSQDRQITQMWELLNEEGADLARRYPWQILVNEWNFNTVNGVTQSNAIPPDFDRFINNTTFDRSTRRGVVGPVTAQRWQSMQAQPIIALVYLSYRMRTGQYIMYPVPPGGQHIYLEYVSANWANGVAGQPDAGAKTSFTQDTDTTVLDEELMTLGLRWRFQAAKGLDYSESMKTYEMRVEQAIARDGGATELSTTPRPIDPMRINLPDGYFGVPYP
jgi:hypothetical protein